MAASVRDFCTVFWLICALILSIAALAVPQWYYFHDVTYGMFTWRQHDVTEQYDTATHRNRWLLAGSIMMVFCLAANLLSLLLNTCAICRPRGERLVLMSVSMLCGLLAVVLSLTCFIGWRQAFGDWPLPWTYSNDQAGSYGPGLYICIIVSLVSFIATIASLCSCVTPGDRKSEQEVIQQSRQNLGVRSTTTTHSFA